MNIKISKSALIILLGSTILFGCSNNRNEHISEIPENNTPTKEVENGPSINSEEDLINFFKDEINELEKTKNNEPLEKFKEKCYNQTVKYEDFILNGTEIKGYKFDELTDNGKQIIIDSSMKLDSIIIEYFPEYKEYISNKIIAMEVWAKDKTIRVIGEENYEKFGIKKDEILGKTKEYYNSAKEKVKNLYEEYKNNHVTK